MKKTGFFLENKPWGLENNSGKFFRNIIELGHIWFFSLKFTDFKENFA